MSAHAELDNTIRRARFEALVILGAVALLVWQLRRSDLEFAAARSEMVMARGRAERAEDAAEANKATIDKLLEELHAQRHGPPLPDMPGPDEEPLGS